MKIGVTSKSQLKKTAVINACESVGIIIESLISIDCHSGVNDQPFGLDETLLGAENRLSYFKTEMFNRKEEYDMIISMENGIVKMGNRYIDLAVIVIELEGCGKAYVTSFGIEFQAKYVNEARQRGFYSNTVGSVMSEMIECSSNDPHLALTHGLFSRQEILTDAIVKCLARIYQPCLK